MALGRHEDWLRVVYGAPAASPAAVRPRAGAEPMGIDVRQSPAVLDPGRASRGQQRVRVTVVPPGTGRAWSLYLRDLAAEAGAAVPARVSWRLEPGTWQPLAGGRQRVARGRGRVRLDVDVRLEAAGTGAHPAPRLSFTAAFD